MSASRPRCLHILPTDLTRGAQRYARALRDALDGPSCQHRTLALFAGPPGALGPDECLGVPPGPARSAGLDPRVVARLRRFLAAHRPDVVVAHGGEPLKYAALARRPGAALVYYKIGTAGPLLANPVRRRLHTWALRRADAVAAVSQAAAAEARDRLGVPARRLVVIPNGRDPADFPLRAPPAPGTPVRLLFAGHLAPSKRPERFVAAVAALRARGAAVTARMAGDGPLLGPLGPRAAAAGVELLGARDDMGALLAASDVLVFTSLPAGEGMPGVLIEAALAGVPVVATDVPGAREVVADGETGLVVPVDDFGALVGALADLVGDAERRERMGAAARRRALARFTLAASARAWAAFLDRLVAGSGTAEAAR